MCKMSDFTLCTFNIIFSDKQLFLNWITFIQNIWIEGTLFKRVFVSLQQHNTLYHLLHCCQGSGGHHDTAHERKKIHFRLTYVAVKNVFKLPIVTNFYEAW